MKVWERMPERQPLNALQSFCRCEERHISCIFYNTKPASILASDGEISDTAQLDYAQPASPALKMPCEELADAIDLIIVPAVREGGEFNPQFFEPGGAFGQPDMAGLDAGGLGMQPGDLVVLRQERGGVRDAVRF